MSRKKLFDPALVSVLAAFATLTVLIVLPRTHWNDLMAGMFALMLYGLVVISYLLRVGLIVVAVSALYRLFWRRVHVHSQQEYISNSL